MKLRRLSALAAVLVFGLSTSAIAQTSAPEIEIVDVNGSRYAEGGQTQMVVEFRNLPEAPDPAVVNAEAKKKEPADEVDGPPFVSCKVWAIADGATGKVLYGSDEDKPVDVASTTTQQWELLQAPNGVQPANEFIVYSKGGGADYYLDNAEVYATP